MDQKEVVDELLENITRKRRGPVLEGKPELVEAIQYFLGLKRVGDPRVCGVTLSWFYTNRLRDKYDGPSSMSTVRSYVRDVLKLDTTTGEAL